MNEYQILRRIFEGDVAFVSQKAATLKMAENGDALFLDEVGDLIAIYKSGNYAYVKKLG